MRLSNFIPIKRLGKGGYGTVILAKQISKNSLVAIKIMKISDIVRKNAIDKVQVEQKIFKQLSESHLNLIVDDFMVHFCGSFKTKTHLFLVLDYCQNGDLSDLLDQSGSFGERWSAWLIAEIALGLSVLHRCGIIYNDLKPENCLMSDDGHVKFTDFGISQFTLKQQIAQSRAMSRIQSQSRSQSFSKDQVYTDQVERPEKILGTPCYLAPELFQGQSPSFKSDFWALGVCLFEFVFGVKPFQCENLEELFDQISFSEVKFPVDQQVSPMLKDLIEALLKKDPGKRLCKIDDLKAHPFFKEQNVQFDNIFKRKPPYIPVKQKLEFKLQHNEDWEEFLDNETKEECSSFEGMDFHYTNANIPRLFTLDE
uniref:non-specific serine/threonine protein kinase n=1 Tax=Trepomonas sp. PC1 TaxID=1076344 RepID=A0A146KF95_9EUKA|eukprot:JAP94858.1 Kinase, AGC PKA [Trepomonas sp. PC1]